MEESREPTDRLSYPRVPSLGTFLFVFFTSNAILAGTASEAAGNNIANSIISTATAHTASWHRATTIKFNTISLFNSHLLESAVIVLEAKWGNRRRDFADCIEKHPSRSLCKTSLDCQLCPVKLSISDVILHPAVVALDLTSPRYLIQ